MERPELLLVRHGETDSNLEARYAGWNDDRLNARGREQTFSLAARLRPFRVRRVYTSPVRRAVETAEFLSAEIGADVRTVHDLREIEVGPWKDLTEGEVKARWPAEYAEWKAAAHRFSLEGRESLLDVQRRALDAVDRIAHAELSEPERPVVVVTHLALIRVLWLAALSEPLSRYQEIEVKNGDLRAIRWLGRGRVAIAGLAPPGPA
ncbi:MAG: histidine phosphatase family protein [Gemmatimonadota bacterium]